MSGSRLIARGISDGQAGCYRERRLTVQFSATAVRQFYGVVKRLISKGWATKQGPAPCAGFRMIGDTKVRNSDFSLRWQVPGSGIAVSRSPLCYLEVDRDALFGVRGSMRKRIVGQHDVQSGSKSNQGWLALEQIATVEVTSEDPSFPIEGAFRSSEGPGWRASEPGEQRIRIIFDHPVSLHRIELRFHEADLERTQEFTLRWSPATGAPSIEIVRQQWNFSPAGATEEIEQYMVYLEAVSVLELAIRPDLNRPEAVASLASCRLG